MHASAVTGHSNPPGGIDELERTIAFVAEGRSAGANPPAGEDGSGTVVLASPRAELPAGGAPEATLLLEHHAAPGHAVAGVDGRLEATFMLSRPDLAIGGAPQPATMVLGDRREDPTATVAMSMNEGMVDRAGDGAPLAATMRLPEAGLPHTVAGHHGGVTMQVDAASHPVRPSPAPAPFLAMAGPPMAVPPASTSGLPAARGRVGLWMAIGTLVAAVAGVVVGLLLSGG